MSSKTTSSSAGGPATATHPASAFADAYSAIRERSRSLFDVIAEEAYYEQPISLRHPIVFYEGHLPAFSFNTLIRRGLGGRSIDERLERLFARGIDPDTDAEEAEDARHSWPSREVVRSFATEVDRQVLDRLRHGDIDRPGHPLLDRAEAVHTILEHEALHQETLLYMWHRLPHHQKVKPAGYAVATDAAPPAQEWVRVEAGPALLGVDREAQLFGWDNEHPHFAVQVEAFDVDRHNVTNAAYLEFVEAGGYQDERWWSPEDRDWLRTADVHHPGFWVKHGSEWFWQGMFDLLPLPLSWPVYVSHAEASAFARWRGARLMTEAEFQRAAFGSPDGTSRRHPWGDDAPGAAHGVFDFVSWDPQPAGSHASGQSAWGVHDLVGNGWEWTSTPFAPFPGFRAMASYPEYSADFFDGQHFVLKGASPATARTFLRPSFRNWFRARYPFVYASFRCARDAR